MHPSMCLVRLQLCHYPENLDPKQFQWDSYVNNAILSVVAFSRTSGKMCISVVKSIEVNISILNIWNGFNKKFWLPAALSALSPLWQRVDTHTPIHLSIKIKNFMPSMSCQFFPVLSKMVSNIDIVQGIEVRNSSVVTTLLCGRCCSTHFWCLHYHLGCSEQVSPQICCHCRQLLFTMSALITLIFLDNYGLEPKKRQHAASLSAQLCSLVSSIFIY